MAYVVTLDQTTVDRMVCHCLQQCVTLLERDVVELENLSQLEDYQFVDLQNHQHNLRALRTVISYLGVA